MPSLGMWELIIILVIVLLIFGVGKLPQVGEGLGKAIRGFRRSLTEAESKDTKDTPDEASKKTGDDGP